MEIFHPLSAVPGVRATFFGRIPGVDVDTDRSTALERLRPYHDNLLRQQGFDPRALAMAEQVHAARVAVVERPGFYAGADALVTASPDVSLGIYVADCAAVYVAASDGRAIGLVHSGRAGTEANIIGRTLETMCERFSLAPRDLLVQLSPCIRPPHYETDFAATIAAQARAVGVLEVLDDGICTGSRLAHYYSYRMEKGRTGRMFAVLAIDKSKFCPLAPKLNTSYDVKSFLPDAS